MTTSTTENETAQATAAAAEGPEPPKKAHTAARKPRVAPSKPKAARKTTCAKKVPTRLRQCFQKTSRDYSGCPRTSLAQSASWLPLVHWPPVLKNKAITAERDKSPLRYRQPHARPTGEQQDAMTDEHLRRDWRRQRKGG